MNRYHMPAIALLFVSWSAGNTFADIELPGECTFPEGITSTSDGSIFISSMQYGAIYKAEAGAKKAEVFIAPNSNGMVSTLGLYADEANNRLIACTADPGIAHKQVGDDRFTGEAGSGIRIFDLKTGNPLGSLDFPGGGFCNDIAVDKEAAIFATDTFNGRIFKAKGEDIRVWAEGETLSNGQWTLNGIDYSPSDDTLIIGNQSTGQIFKVGFEKDRSIGAIEDVKLSRPLKVPDGIRLIDAKTLGVIEAGSAAYSTVDLSTGVVSTIGSSLQEPATFTKVGSKVFFTSAQGSQFWAADGDCKKAAKPFQIIEMTAQ